MNLIFVHGFLGNSLNWLPITQRLRAKMLTGELNIKQLITVDLLGHGKKSKLPEGQNLTLENIARDLFLEIPDEPFIAVGHSFGVRPLLTMMKLPERIKNFKAFIVEDSSPIISDAGYQDLRQIFDDVQLPQPTRAEARVAIEKAFSHQPRLARFLMTNLEEKMTSNGPEQTSQFAWRFEPQQMKQLLEESRTTELWAEWQSFPGPIEMILGAQSAFVPEARVQECVSRRGSLKTGVHYIEDAGHWVHADQPELFTNAIVKIVKLV